VDKQSFPETEELIEFFGTTPDARDDQPWHNSHITFHASSTNGTFELELRNQDNQASLTWYQQHQVVVRLELKGIRSIRIIADELKFSFKSPDVDDLFVGIDPHIRINWCYNDQP